MQPAVSDFARFRRLTRRFQAKDAAVEAAFKRLLSRSGKEDCHRASCLLASERPALFLKLVPPCLMAENETEGRQSVSLLLAALDGSDPKTSLVAEPAVEALGIVPQDSLAAAYIWGILLAVSRQET